MAAAVAAAGCQKHGLETQHVSSCWYFYFSISPFFLLHVYFRCIQHIETAMAAATAAWVQDVTTGLETWTTGAAGEEDNG
jgi:hypothetical protein